jgi:phosphoribosylanthranilate isomerase
MTKIKICGITRHDDALAAALAGADALGFNFSEKSPRLVSPDSARRIIAKLPPFITSVGVFVEQSPEEIVELCRYCGLQVAQLHSNAYGTGETLRISGVKVMRVFRTDPDFTVSQVREFAEKSGCHDFLFDAFSPDMAGGTGKTIAAQTASAIFDAIRDFAWALLAGGLRHDNVANAVRLVRPWGVDTASGVERAPGIKEALMIRQFIDAVRQADRELSRCWQQRA